MPAQSYTTVYAAIFSEPVKVLESVSLKIGKNLWSGSLDSAVYCLQLVQIWSGTHPDPSMVTEGSFPGVKLLAREVNPLTCI